MAWRGESPCRDLPDQLRGAPPPGKTNIVFSANGQVAPQTICRRSIRRACRPRIPWHPWNPAN
jgi:hypothetical protein